MWVCTIGMKCNNLWGVRGGGRDGGGGGVFRGMFRGSFTWFHFRRLHLIMMQWSVWSFAG